jgi:hypothetical protein
MLDTLLDTNAVENLAQTTFRLSPVSCVALYNMSNAWSLELSHFFKIIRSL